MYWSVTVILSKKIDTLYSWCLRRILNVDWSESVTNDEIRSRTGQPFLSDTVRSRRLSFFGHLHHTDPSQDHYRALQACIMGPVDDWRRRVGRPRQSWLRTVEANLRPMNLGLATSKRRAQVRSTWRKLIATASLRLRQAASPWREIYCVRLRSRFLFFLSITALHSPSNISEPLKMKACAVQRTIDRKWPMGNRMITWPIMSREPERSSRDPNTLKAQYLENSCRC